MPKNGIRLGAKSRNSSEINSTMLLARIKPEYTKDWKSFLDCKTPLHKQYSTSPITNLTRVSYNSLNKKNQNDIFEHNLFQ